MLRAAGAWFPTNFIDNPLPPGKDKISARSNRERRSYGHRSEHRDRRRRGPGSPHHYGSPGQDPVRQGCRVLFVQDYQSRIRGGHLFNRIRVADQPLMSSREGIDLLVALNQETVLKHRGRSFPRTG